MADDLPQVTAVLLDIEGTVCSISFVRDVLMPYAVDVLPQMAAAKWDNADFRGYVDAFPNMAQSSANVFSDFAINLMQQDSKVPYLKQLQGACVVVRLRGLGQYTSVLSCHLWKSGWESGAFVAPLYPDVAPELRHWHASGKLIAIFSSRSVAAQMLLLGHVGTADGGTGPGGQRKKHEAHHPFLPADDLTGLIAHYFDTQNAGPKQDTASYEKIARTLGKPCREILFLSDNVTEVKAALEAGMESVVIDRPGNNPLSDHDRSTFAVHTSFKGIHSTRRAMLDPVP